MNLVLLEQVVNIYTKEECYDQDDYMCEFEDKINTLKAKSDLAIVNLRDNRKVVLSHINFNGGTCGCCLSFYSSDILNISFYKIKE